MDWALKASSGWDSTEFTRDHFTVLSDGSSILENWSKECFSVDLGFDNTGDENVSKFKEPKGSSMRSPRGLSKKTKLQNTSCQNVSCLVDGCKSDLSGCREYHRRHRVCECHSKTPVVLIRGKEQRFCQQCSRFHSLSEFDEVKRSCRKRLDGHNRRRRKPRPDSLYLNCGSLLANNQGTKILHFGAPQAFTTGFGSLSWPNEDKHHQKSHVIVQQKNDANSFACDHSGREKKFPFLLVSGPDIGNQALPKVSSSQQALYADLTGKDEVLTPLVESKRALSLLSTHKIQTPGSTPSHLMQQDVLIHLNQPTDSCLQFDSLVKHLESQPISTGLAPTIVREGSHFNGMIHFRPERFLENESSQVVSFSWS